MFDKFLESTADAGIALHCAEISIHGKTVLKRCFDEDKCYPVYSATKSVTSAAVLMAQGEGKLDISDKLYKYLDKKYTNIIPAPFRALSFRDFMTMTSAPYPFRPQEVSSLIEDPNEDDWIENILYLPVEYSDRSFHYSNIPAYLVSSACENAVDMPLAEYLRPRLFEPLGWGRPVYQTSPEGHFYGATGMELSVSQLARLGQLFMQEGSWQGEQLMPKELVREAVTAHSDTGKSGYGYFIWVTDNTFAISGKWGQRCVVCPDKELIVTYLSHQPDRSGELADIAEHFIDEFQEA